jgi:hypothetical protein
LTWTVLRDTLDDRGKFCAREVEQMTAVTLIGVLLATVVLALLARD